ncbi:MAG: ArsR family transcriptional regulator [Acidimicrobiales bacterium]|nr:ArsR family transcriptional regulator [Acidimicrobiales bacterium]
MATDLLAANDTLAALGDGTRRAIVELLAERPRAVGELASVLPVTRPAVSLHLKVLKDARLVRVTPIGTRRVYALDVDGLALLRTYIDRLWAGALDRFAAAAEAAHAAGAARPASPAITSPTDPQTHQVVDPDDEGAVPA